MATVRVTIETDHAVLKDLSPEQAKELRDILLQMFPVEKQELVPQGWYRPYPYWNEGIPPSPWVVTYGSSNTATISCKTE